MDNKVCDNYVFKHPFTSVVAGPTKSGKTRLVFEIIDSLNEYVTPQIDKIYYCYSEWQPAFDNKPHIEFIRGVIDYDSLCSTVPKLVVIDDLMEEGVQNRTVVDLFTKGSHHKNLSVFFLTQNLFLKGRYSRTISLNSTYLILFKNPRDQSQIRHLASQMFPTNQKFLIEAYNDATKKPHGYLFIDNNQSTDNELRIQTDIVQKVRIVYVPK